MPKKKTASKPVPEMMRRQAAVEKTMMKFAKHELRLGQADCIKMARFLLVQLGHRRIPSPTYKGEKGAVQMLKAQGVKDVEGLVDKFLPRIAPAEMRLGDLGMVPAEPGAPAWRAGTIVICLGRKFLGWHPDHPMLAVVEPTVDNPYIAAWRV